MEHYSAVQALLRTALWGSERYPLCPEENTDWAQVSRELTHQAVDALVADILQELPQMPPQIHRELMYKTTRRLTTWHKLMREQDALQTLFRQADIPFLILKGSAAAMYYPRPECRAMGDVDVIVRREDFGRAYQLMLDNGFAPEPGEADRKADAREVELMKNGVAFELHRRFAVLKDRQKAECLDDRIMGEIGCGQEVDMAGHRFPAATAVTNGLVLLVHINQHLDIGLGLRQIIDWMLYVDRELDDNRWEQEFGPLAEELGLDTLAVTVTRMCQQYLGLREPGISWCAGADEALCTKLMEVTMLRGNFGIKKRTSNAAVRMLNSIHGIPSLFRRLQAHGCQNWKLLKKHPWLKCVAWFYQLCRYLRMGFSRKNPLRSLFRDIRRSKKEAALWAQLELSKPEK